MKGEYTPQGLFDVDPKKFMIEYMKEENFVYLGMEEKALRRGDNKNWYHKVLVKEGPILECLNKYLKQEPNYVPVPGRVVTYAQFMAYVCENSNTKKKAAELEKEKKLLAKKHSVEELIEMEKKELALVDAEYDREREDLVKHRSEVESQISSSANSMQELASYSKVKDLIEQRFSDADNKRVTKKLEYSSYYTDVKRKREEIEVLKAAVAVERNNKRKLKRFDEKQSRMRQNNGLDSVPNNASVTEASVSSPAVVSIPNTNTVDVYTTPEGTSDEDSLSPETLQNVVEVLQLGQNADIEL